MLGQTLVSRPIASRDELIRTECESCRGEFVAKSGISELLHALGQRARAPLAQLPTPLHRLENFGRALNLPELWIKRDDLTGLEGGGNKTRKLEFLVGDAIESGCDMLVTAGAIQSNHTRQTAAAAAKCNLKCALLHFAWTKDAGPLYRQSGNILLSSLMGAELYLDETDRPIEDQSPLLGFAENLRRSGHNPYLIPAGASEHRLGSFGYMACAAELVLQSREQNVQFDYIVHCTGSSSTQAGLVAGLAFFGEDIRVIGVADDYETDIKGGRVLELANNALAELEASARVAATDIEVISADQSDYGKSEPETFDVIRRLACNEGLVADPVYEGKALRGLQKLAAEGRFEPGSKILLMHLGGTPAVHAYANQFGIPDFSRL
jgi:1-aminocyclopropane-1-carboxylate deaminase